MHGVGDSVPGLADFVGRQLLAVDDLENITYFRFSDASEDQLQIGVESEWSIRDGSGAIIASGQPRPNNPLADPPLGSVVVAAQPMPPRAIALWFASGHMLEIIDNSDQYESFCIPHTNVYI